MKQRYRYLGPVWYKGTERVKEVALYTYAESYGQAMTNCRFQLAKRAGLNTIKDIWISLPDLHMDTPFIKAGTYIDEGEQLALNLAT